MENETLKKKVVIVRKKNPVDKVNPNGDKPYKKPYKKSHKKYKKANEYKSRLYLPYFDKVKKFDSKLEFKKIQKQFLNILGSFTFENSNFIEYGYYYCKAQAMIFQNLVNFWSPENIKKFMEKNKDKDIFYDPEKDDKLLEAYKTMKDSKYSELSELFRDEYEHNYKLVEIDGQRKKLFIGLLPLVDDVKKDN